MADNYDQLIERISGSSGLEKEEIERKIEAKRAKLSGLVSREGAAQIVAAELGLNLDQERLKISELVHGMKRSHVIGKIVELYPVRSYNKNGKEGKVANFLIGDESGNTRAVLWDTNHIELVEKGKLQKGDVVEITNANVRNGELHLSSFGDIKKSKEKLDNVVSKIEIGEKKLSDVKPGDSFMTRAVVMQTFEPRYFQINKKTGRKPKDDELEKDKDSIEKRALLNIVLDDGSETIRAIVVGDNIKLLGLEDEEIFDIGKFSVGKEKVLGEEYIFSGNLRQNQLYNTVEFSVNNVQKVDPEKLIAELEAKS